MVVMVEKRSGATPAYSCYLVIGKEWIMELAFFGAWWAGIFAALVLSKNQFRTGSYSLG
jgi:hypothetical protein